MSTTQKKRHKPNAVNDNNRSKAGKELGVNLHKLPKAHARKTVGTDTPLAPLHAFTDNRDEANSSIARTPKLQAIFLLILGFTLTSMASLAFVSLTGHYKALLPILIPTIMLGGMCLIAMRSFITLWLSIAAMSIWGIFAALAQYDGGIIPMNDWLLALPIILSLQIVIANKSQSRALMLASVVCAYLWLAIFTLGSDLSALASGSLVFILGTAHHRLGKSWGDSDINYAHEHTLIGWIAAMTGLIWVQHSFIQFGEFTSNNIGSLAHQSFYWILGTTLGFSAIIISSLWRIRNNRLSWIGFWCLSIGSLILPLITYNVGFISIFEEFSTLPATPYFGFALGAVIMAFATGLIINGLRRRYYVDVIIGTLTILAQLATLLKPIYVSFDMLFIVTITMMLALCFELTIARQSIISSA